MSKKVMASLVGVVASLAVAAGTMQGCGSSSSSGGDYQALCNQGCDKVASCTPDGGAAVATVCKMACTQHCSNEAAIVSKLQECLKISDCTAAQTCGAMIPDCQTTTGSGGSTGAGGSGTGTGGSGTGGSGTGTGGSGTGTGGTSGGAWTCMDQPGTGCTCLQDPGGNLTSCPSSYTCCFTADFSGLPTCNCTTPMGGLSCAQTAAALSGSVVSKCPQ